MEILNNVRTTKKTASKSSMDSIQNPYIRENMRKLIANQKDVRAQVALFEDFSTGVGAPSGLANGIPNGGDQKGVFAPIAMALVRRVFPQLFANNFVGVQPLNGPVGLAYALRFLYNDPFSKEAVEAAWKAVPEYSGFSGSTQGTKGMRDQGTATDTQIAEPWKVAGEGEKEMPSIGIMFSRQAIVAKSRKLAASFSVESIQDIQKMQNINIITEMLDFLQREMALELDRETINKCRKIARKVTFERGKVNYAGEDDAWNGRWSQERFSTLVTQLINLNNDIHTATRIAAGNACVVSPRVATILQSMNVVFTRNTSEVNATAATPEIGTLNGSIKVYRDSFAGDVGQDYALFGYKGSGNSDCGIIYCPYVTGLVNQAKDPNDFSQRIGIMSRYAFAENMLGAENYYRLAVIEGLGEVLPDAQSKSVVKW